MVVAEELPAITNNSRALQQHIFSLLQTCKSINKLTQIHTQIITNGFSKKSFLTVNLISLYVAYGHFQRARKVFDEMPSPTTTAWNQMIRGYSHTETPNKAVELYVRMVGKGYEPDEYTYSYLVSACARFSMFREGEQVHGRVLATGYCSNVFVGTSLVNLYCSVGSCVGFGDAQKVFDEMPRRNVETWNSLLAGCFRCGGDVGGALRIFDEMPERSVVSWTTMISGCARSGWFREGLLLFREMRRGDVEVDQTVLVAALSACAELGDLSFGKLIHSYASKKFEGLRQESGVRLQNALVHMYASCGVIEEAYMVFREMPRRTVVSWTSMIIGYAKHGFAEKTLELFRWMEKSGEVRPDSITFVGVLSACSHAGYVEEGRRYFKEMKEKWAIEPHIEHYGCMADLLARAGLLHEALRHIESMPMKPNDVVWGALLNGCMIHRNHKIASYAAQSLMMDLDRDQIVDYLVPISNVYSAAKRWKEVAALRQKIGEKGLRNSSGQSWVQVKGENHDFVAGDNTHKHASSVYETVNSLTREMRCEAYNHDIDENSLLSMPVERDEEQ